MTKNRFYDYQGLVPPYLAELEVYQAGKPIEELAREKKLEKITKLASNENPFGPSPDAIREMTNKIWSIHHYPDMHAIILKNKLAQLYQLKNENIILGSGSEGIMSNIARTFVQPGDEVLSSHQSFIGFTILAKGAGAKLVRTPLTQDHRYDVEAMAKLISNKTKIIYIANPNNPTGTYIKKEEFDYLMKFVPDRTMVILDEAYFEFAQAEADYPDSMDYRYDDVITLRTFSKAYGLAGIRLGYGFGHPTLISHLHKAKLPFEPSSIAQAGGHGALSDQIHLERTLKNNKKRMLEIVPYLKEKGFSPINSVANFVTFNTGSIEAAKWMFENLLNEGVIIRNLIVNEMPTSVRVSIGTKEHMEHFYQGFDKIFPHFLDLHGKVRDQLK